MKTQYTSQNLLIRYDMKVQNITTWFIILENTWEYLNYLFMYTWC